MNDCKRVATSLDTSRKLVKPETINEEFRELIGSLLYLAVAIRPDMSYGVNSLRQFNNCYN